MFFPLCKPRQSLVLDSMNSLRMIVRAVGIGQIFVVIGLFALLLGTGPFPSFGTLLVLMTLIGLGVASQFRTVVDSLSLPLAAINGCMVGLFAVVLVAGLSSTEEGVTEWTLIMTLPAMTTCVINGGAAALLSLSKGPPT